MYYQLSWRFINVKGAEGVYAKTALQLKLLESTCSSKNYVLPEFEIFVGQDLSFSVQIFGWMLTEDHEIYSMYERSFFNVTLSNFIHQLKEFILCNGITVPDSSKELNCQIHVLPKKSIIMIINLRSANHVCVKMNIIVPALVKS